MNKLPDKILIVCFGAIGDVTRALPLVARIKKNSPNTKIHWAIEPRSRSIIENHPYIDKIHEFFRPGGFLVFVRFLRELRRENFEMVLDLQRHFKSGVTSYASGANKRIAFNKKNSREFNWIFATDCIKPQEHFSSKVEHYQAFGDYLGLERDKSLDFGMRASEQSKLKIKQLIGAENSKSRMVALILGSTWPSRFWVKDYYVDLIKKLHEKWGVVSVLVGGPSEERFAEEIIAKSNPSQVINLVKKTSLHDLIALFQAVSCSIGSDSGPMHIASASGCPMISLWGSTSHLRSAPYGSEDLVIASKVGCSPCYKANCPGLNTLCMQDISVESVLAIYSKLLDSNRLAI